MTAWVVRAGGAGEFEEFALRAGIVSIGFSLQKSVADFANRDELQDHLRRESSYKDSSAQSVGAAVSQLWQFANEIQRGDMVLLPRKNPRVVAVGKVDGSYVCRPEQADTLPHTRSVKWLANDVPRDSFSRDPDIQKSLGGRRTVFQVGADEAESRIARILEVHFEEGTLIDAEPVEIISAPIEEDTHDISLEEENRNRIVQRIRQKFSGTRLEYFVACILRASGYEALQTRGGPDGGVDVLAGMGDMGFGEPRLCVQVKSGAAPVGLPDYNRLQGNIQGFGAQHGLLVSLSGFTRPVLRENERSFFQIRLWGSKELVDSLLETYDSLPADIRADVPLENQRVLVESED